MINTRKKEKDVVNYKKFAEMPQKDALNFVRDSTAIELRKEVLYDDGSRSMTITIHLP